MADIVIFGAGQIAEVAKTYIDAHGPDRVVGFTVDASYRTMGSFAGLPLVSWETLEQHYPPGQAKLLGPLSYRRLNEFRRDRHLEGVRRGYSFASFIHPACHIYTTAIGENCFILEGNTLQPFVRVGAGVMMWSNNHIGHHSVIGDYSFLASHVGLGGSTRIGERCFLAGKVGVENGVTVGDGCFLGSRVLVTRDLPAESVIPARGDPVGPYPASRIKRLI
ncbi:acetyltransferase [Aminobacter sp. HY435]|uniref:acetyltransferase n=1 Tax=Aminobacter sp. HY435 TaxID=2970917 RepID=UPI0022B9CE1A|nr:acetyltransferase [Aminobacter sp. HY435]